MSHKNHNCYFNSAAEMAGLIQVRLCISALQNTHYISLCELSIRSIFDICWGSSAVTTIAEYHFFQRSWYAISTDPTLT